MICPICGKDVVKKKAHFTCLNCTHSFKSINNSVEFHSSEFRKRAKRVDKEIVDGKVTSRFHKARKDIVKQRIDRVRKLGIDHGLYLDIGAGAGTFAKAFSSDKAIVECLELDTILLNEIDRLGLTAYQEPIEKFYSEVGYDAIFAWHSLEHVESLHSCLSKVSEMSDVFVGEVPVDRKIPHNFDGHVHYFTEQSLKALLEQYFDEVEITSGIQQPALMFYAKQKDSDCTTGETKLGESSEQVSETFWI